MRIPMLVLMVETLAYSATPDVREENLNAGRAIRFASIRFTMCQQLRPLNAADAPGLDPTALAIVNLNRDLNEECTLTLDVQRRHWKMDQRDLRNVDVIMKAANVPAREFGAVSRSMIILSWGSGRAHCRLDPPWSRVTVLPDRGSDRREAVFDSPLQPGCWPDSVFDGASLRSEEVIVDGRSLLALTLETPRSRVVIHADPAIGYRYRRWERYVGGKIAERRIADDYRVVDDVPFPFHHETWGFGSAGEVLRHDLIAVQSAQFNKLLNPADLSVEIPIGTVLEDLVQKFSLRLRQPRVVDTSSLRTLIIELNKEAKENLQSSRPAGVGS